MKRSQFLGMLIGLPFIGKVPDDKKISGKCFGVNESKYCHSKDGIYKLSKHAIESWEVVNRNCCCDNPEQFFEGSSDHKKLSGDIKYGFYSAQENAHYPMTKYSDGKTIYGYLAGKPIAFASSTFKDK